MSWQMRGLQSVFGIAACVWLAACPPEFQSGYSFVNRRDHPLELTTREARECGEDVDLSDADNYEPEESHWVDPQRVEPLGEPPYMPYSPDASVSPSCRAVWLRVDGGPEVVLKWQGEPYGHSPLDASSAIVFQGPRDRVLMQVPSSITLLAAPR